MARLAKLFMLLGFVSLFEDLVLCSIFKCVNDNECSGDTLTCSSDGDCVVICTGSHSCLNSTILCPENGGACDVIGGVEACHSCNIFGYNGNNIVVGSNSDSAFSNAHIDALNADSLMLHAFFGGFEICEIFCPNNENDGYDTCILNGNSDAFLNAEIKAVSGFNDVTFNSEFEVAILYCESDFSKSCQLYYDSNESKMKCDPNLLDGTYCETYEAPENTSHPTPNPTPDPTPDPTPQPTPSPSDTDEVICPTFSEYNGVKAALPDDYSECPINFIIEGASQIYKCVSQHCTDINENEFCSIMSGNGCVECENGYFYANRETPCISSDVLEHCLCYKNYKGCTLCEEGYEKTWYYDCNMHICVSSNNQDL